MPKTMMCVMCGESIPNAYGNRRFCNDCLKERKRQRSKEYARLNYRPRGDRRGANDPMTDEELAICKSMADNSLTVSTVAKEIGCSGSHVETVSNHIQDRTGHDPREFWGLYKLLEAANIQYPYWEDCL